MIISLAQIKPFRGNFEENIKLHKRFIDLALDNATDFIIFPELSLTGYETEYAKSLATNEADPRLDDFQQIANTRQITICVGLPTSSAAGSCISLIIFQPRKDRVTYSKKYLHVDEIPFFVPGTKPVQVLQLEKRIAVAICYELSVPTHADDAAAADAEIYIASVAKSATGMEKAYASLSSIAVAHRMQTLICNCTGIWDGVECLGNSAVWNSQGELLGQLQEQEGLLIYDTKTEEVKYKEYPFIISA